MSDLESRLRAALHDETSDLAAGPTLADDMVARGTTARRRRRVAGGVAGLAVLAALVPVWKTIDTSSGDLGPVGPHTVTAPTTVTQTTASPTTPEPPPYWTTKTVDVVSQRPQTSKVVNLRVGEHATFDRVVIDLTGAMTGYHIEYVKRLFHGGSGFPVHLPGNAFLVIRLNPAQAHTNRGRDVFGGDTRQVLALPTVRGAALTGDVEGVSFGLGLSKKATFHVSELTSPTRLVIDVRH